MRIAVALALFAVAFRAASAAPAPCPDGVTAAALKAIPNSTVKTCKAERADGVDQFEVKLVRKDKSVVDVDVSADGKVLVIEQSIAIDKVPAAVTKAFAARYPKAKATAAELQQVTSKDTRYELAFAVDGKRKEATFQADGTFVDEE